ncbi:hypothetical protein F4802DRAFT_614831 [Xylaria palmicola]|nr:hypothetical protein F4802DRAFT_614831 [Xylaria palmicola]
MEALRNTNNISACLIECYETVKQRRTTTLKCGMTCFLEPRLPVSSVCPPSVCRRNATEDETHGGVGPTSMRLLRTYREYRMCGASNQGRSLWLTASDACSSRHVASWVGMQSPILRTPRTIPRGVTGPCGRDVRLLYIASFSMGDWGESAGRLTWYRAAERDLWVVSFDVLGSATKTGEVPMQNFMRRADAPGVRFANEIPPSPESFGSPP